MTSVGQIHHLATFPDNFIQNFLVEIGQNDVKNVSWYCILANTGSKEGVFSPQSLQNPSYQEWLLLSKLGPPEQWKKDNIIAMKEIFNYLPMHLVTRIIDTEALQTL